MTTPTSSRPTAHQARTPPRDREKISASLGSLVFDYEGGPLNFWGLLFGIGGAIIVVLAYGAITGNKAPDRRVTR